jgi:hypothetical protein
MTFELTPETEKTPDEKAALAKAKAKADREDARSGCAAMLLMGVVLVGAGFGVKSCLSSAGKPSPERTAEKAARDLAISEGRDWDAVERDPENYVTADYVSNGDGSISGKLINRSHFFIANVKVRCDEYGETRKRLDRSELTITKSVPPLGSVSFGPLFVTILNQQTTTLDCGTIDGEVGPNAPAP